MMMSILEISSILEMGLIYGVVAVGIYLSFRVLDFPDLTCDGSFVSGAASSIIALKCGIPPLITLMIAMIVGALTGLVTGILNRCCYIADLLSGILVSFMLYSVNLKIMGGIPNLSIFYESTIFSGLNSLSVLLIIAIFIWLIFSYLLSTDFGLGLRSIGQNKTLASNCGIKISSYTIIGLMLSNALIALGGALFSQYQEFVDISQGTGTVIFGLASVMIGEKLLHRYSMLLVVLSCFIGSILYRFIIGAALHSELLGLGTQDLNLIAGLIVVIVMYFPIKKKYY